MKTVSTKDVGDVKDKFAGDYKNTLEECNEDYIKWEMGIDG